VLEGSRDGPLQTRWRIRAWPTVYVLDETGVIRAQHVRGKELDEIVRRLLSK
jgi:hypothetical protein